MGQRETAAGERVHLGAFVDREQRRQLVDLARREDRSVSAVVRRVAGRARAAGSQTELMPVAAETFWVNYDGRRELIRASLDEGLRGP